MAQPITMTFDNRRNRVRIQKSTLAALGNPNTILPMVNKAKKTYVLRPMTISEAKSLGYSEWDLMHIYPDVYEKGKHYEYQNRNIMPWIRSFMNEWKPFAEYRVRGELRDGVGFFYLDDYEIILQGHPLKIIKNEYIY